MFEAAKDADRAGVAQALADGADVSCEDPTAGLGSPWRLVLAGAAFAASSRDRGVMALLLEHGCNPNQAMSGDGWTALLAAIEVENIDDSLAAMQLLLAAGADPDQAGDSAYTPLYLSIRQHNDPTGAYRATRLLLDNGANPSLSCPNSTTAGWTPVILAADYGNAVPIELLASFGADLAASTASGDTALTVASRLRHSNMQWHHAEVVDFLKEVEGWSGFKMAVVWGDLEAAESALRIGRIDPTDDDVEDVVDACYSVKDLPYPGNMAPSEEMLDLLYGATSFWSPARHFLFHGGVRSCIHLCLLIAERYRRRSAETEPQLLAVEPCVLLPQKLWLEVCSFLLRKDWPVPTWSDNAPELSFWSDLSKPKQVDTDTGVSSPPPRPSPTTGGRGAKAKTSSGAMGKKNKKNKKNSGVNSVARLCCNPACGVPGAKMRCKRCRRVVYCSCRCQKIHWTQGGHKRHCVPLLPKGTTADSAAAAAAAPPAPQGTSVPTTYLGEPVGSKQTGSASSSPPPDANDPVNP